MNAQVHQTPVMKRIFGNGTHVMLEILSERLDRENIVAIPQSQLVQFVMSNLKGSINQAKHLMTELGWTKVHAKWGGAGYKRALWLRPGHSLYQGKVMDPNEKVLEITNWQVLTDEYFSPLEQAE